MAKQIGNDDGQTLLILIIGDSALLMKFSNSCLRIRIVNLWHETIEGIKGGLEKSHVSHQVLECGTAKTEMQ